eukprot:372778_1
MTLFNRYHIFKRKKKLRKYYKKKIKKKKKIKSKTPTPKKKSNKYKKKIKKVSTPKPKLYNSNTKNGNKYAKNFSKFRNKFPSIIVSNRYQTESNRKRSILLVYGYCHLIEILELETFFDIYYSDSNNLKYKIIPMSIIELCHTYLYEKISVDDFKQVTLIGKGGFAEVRLVTYKHSNQNGSKMDNNKFAMKSLSKKLMLKKKQEKQIFIERDILINLNNWLIIKLYWSFQDTKYLHLVEEYCEGGDLMKILMQYETLNDFETQFYISEISSAINYLHINNYVHRDIKPDNILIDKTGHIKLCDFGSAAYYNPNEFQNDIVPKKSRKNRKLLYRIVGTPDYVGPEILRKKRIWF